MRLHFRSRNMKTACVAGILLLKAVQQWQKQHGSNLPASAKEKAAFRSMLKSWQRCIDGVPIEVRSLRIYNEIINMINMGICRACGDC